MAAYWQLTNEIVEMGYLKRLYGRTICENRLVEAVIRMFHLKEN